MVPLGIVTSLLSVNGWINLVVHVRPTIFWMADDRWNKSFEMFQYGRQLMAFTSAISLQLVVCITVISLFPCNNSCQLWQYFFMQCSSAQRPWRVLNQNGYIRSVRSYRYLQHCLSQSYRSVPCHSILCHDGVSLILWISMFCCTMSAWNRTAW